jgi:SmpA / OmlA family
VVFLRPKSNSELKKITTMIRQKFRSTYLAAMAASLFLTACVGYSPQNRFIGSDRIQLVEFMGPPSSEQLGPDGTTLIYSRGPFGKHTYFVYLDQRGTITRWEQVLTEKNFEKIMPGMSRDEVAFIIGESKINVVLARERGYVWHYRYVTPHCRWFQVEFDKEDKVRSTFYGRPPECRAPRSN